MTEQPTDLPTAVEILTRTAGLDDRHRWAELVNAGAALLSAGRPEEAREVLEVAVHDTRRQLGGDDDRDAASALSAALVNLAIVDITRGAEIDLKHGEQLLDEAHGHAARLQLRRRLGTIEVNRARIASLRSQVGAARRSLERAEEHFRSDGALGDLAWAKRALGASLAAAGQLEQALLLQTQAREIFRDDGDQVQADGTEVGLVAIRAELGRPVSDAERVRLEQLSERLSAEAAIQLLGNLANLALRDDLGSAERLWSRARERARACGRAVDEARGDLALAAVARRRGEFRDALQQTIGAGRRLYQLGAWEAAARAEINAALLIGLLADQADPAAAVTLRQEAVEHIVRGVGALDRLRHSLPSPTARRALLRVRYPQLFVAALEAALKAEENDLAAALIERARMQPVLAARRLGDDGYPEPPQLAARPGAVAVDGQPPRVDLTAAAHRLAGPGARWIGWWRADADLLRAETDPDRTRVLTAPFPELAREELDACTARVSPLEAELAASDAALAGRLALARCARAPLLADPRLAARLAATVPASIRVAAEAHLGTAELTLDDVLWPLSQALLGEGLLAELAKCETPPLKLVVAPPPQFGDVPWPMLPLRERQSGESPASMPRLLDAADVVVGLPAALVSAAAPPRRGEGTVAVLDPLGDLPFARRLAVSARRLGYGSREEATPDRVIDAIADAAMLVLSAHVQSGSAEQPAAAALLLSDGHGGSARLSVAQLAAVSAPAVCVILGCDGSGATVADEWTGLATGLVWARAESILTSTWPTIEDRHTAVADAALLAAVHRFGPQRGLWCWQRAQLAAWRHSPEQPACSPYRWAGTIVCGRGSAPG
jgi:tetratricopeptide (TPR) repeat protein